MTSIGIDLGTTHSVASTMQGGRPVVLRNRDDDTLTASVVSYRGEKSNEGEYLVGIRAVRYGKQAPQDTVHSVKRLMGLNYDDHDVQKVKDRVAYSICPALQQDDAGVRVRIGGRLLTPVDVSAMILSQVHADCQARLKQPVTAPLSQYRRISMTARRTQPRKRANWRGSNSTRC